MHQFVDPSLAVAALRAGPERLLADTEALRLLLESFVIRDLRIHFCVRVKRGTEHLSDLRLSPAT